MGESYSVVMVFWVYRKWSFGKGLWRNGIMELMVLVEVEL